MMEFAEIDLRARDRDWSMSSLQSHGYFEIYVLLEGERRLFLDEKIFHVSAPAVCVIPPFCMHKTEGGAYRRINLNISPELLSEREAELLERLSKKALLLSDTEETAFFTELLERAAALSQKHPEDARMSASLLSTLLAFLGETGLFPSLAKESAPASKGDLAVMQAVAYIQSNLRENFSLDTLCAALFISKNSLCSKFRQVMNCSVTEYRTFVRISRAKELLVSTKMSLGEIAEACGYSSANYFSLIFKHEVGISPLNYRKAK